MPIENKVARNVLLSHYGNLDLSDIKDHAVNINNANER